MENLGTNRRDWKNRIIGNSTDLSIENDQKIKKDRGEIKN